MAAPWTEPRTWSSEEVVTAAQLNEQLRDNLKHIGPDSGLYVPQAGMLKVVDAPTGTASTDTAAISNAISEAESGRYEGIWLQHGNGTKYALDTGQTLTQDRFRIEGFGVIEAAAAIDMVTIDGAYEAYIDVEMDGASTATAGIVLADAREADFGPRCNVHHCSGPAYKADTSLASSAPGNNNFCQWWAAKGTDSSYGVDVPSVQDDNNGWEFHAAYMAANDNDGVRYKGSSSKFFGGTYQNNGAYGVRVGESGDSKRGFSNAFYSPYFEFNGTDGLGLGYASRTLFMQGHGPQGLDRTYGDDNTNVEVFVSTSGQGRLQVKSMSGDGIGLEGANLHTLSDDTNQSLSAFPKGTGFYWVRGKLLADDTARLDGQLAHRGTEAGFFGAMTVTQPSAPAVLSDDSGGSTDDTVAAVSGSGDDATINDNFAELAEDITAIRTALVNLGLMA